MILRGWAERSAGRAIAHEKDFGGNSPVLIISALLLVLLTFFMAATIVKPLFFSASRSSGDQAQLHLPEVEAKLTSVNLLLEQGRVISSIHDAEVQRNFLRLEVLRQRIADAEVLLGSAKHLGLLDRDAFDATAQLVQLYAESGLAEGQPSDQGALVPENYVLDEQMLVGSLQSLNHALQGRKAEFVEQQQLRQALQARLAWSLFAVLGIAAIPVVYGIRAMRRLRAARAELGQQQRNFESMLSRVPGAMLVTSPAGLILQVSDALCLLLGYSRQQLLGKTMELLVPPRLSQQYSVLARNAMADGRDSTPRGREMLLRGKAGGEFAVELHLSACDTDRGRSLLVCVRDLREERELYERFRESQKRFDLAALASQDGLWDWNFLTNQMFLSHNWRVMMGWENVPVGEEREHFRRCIPETDRQGFKAALKRFFRDGGYLFTYEHRVMRNNDEMLDVVCRASAQRDSHGRVIRMVGVHTDVTSFKQREREIRRLNRMLEDKVRLSSLQLEEALENADSANRAISAFLAVMGHEIRTPMNGVVGMTELLSKTRLDREQQMMLQTLTRSSEVLLATLDNILDYAALEAGTLVLSPQMMNLAEFIEGIADNVATRVARNHQYFYLSIDPQLPEQVELDPIRLRQMLMALLDNAVKFSAYRQPAGKIKFQVRYEQSKTEPALVLRVMDNGIGVSSEIRSRLFRPFVQADTSRARRFSGTGLGLAIARHLVRLMGGDIHLEESADWKACFLVRIPLAASAKPAAVVSAADSYPVNAVIEDPELAKSVQFALASKGVAVQFFETIDSLRRDMALAGANRSEEARSGGQRMPLVTDDASESMRQQCSELGLERLLLSGRPLSDRENTEGQVYINPLLPSVLYLSLERLKQARA